VNAASRPRKVTEKVTESDIDAVIEKIDQALPRVHALANRQVDTPPTGGFSADKIEQTKRAFQEMSDDTLLTRSGEDVRVATRKASRPPVPQPQPQPQPKLQPQRRRSG